MFGGSTFSGLLPLREAAGTVFSYKTLVNIIITYIIMNALEFIIYTLYMHGCQYVVTNTHLNVLTPYTEAGINVLHATNQPGVCNSLVSCMGFLS